MKKIIKGDEVIVITGDNKGLVSTVLKVIGDYVIVKGVTGIRHVKPDMQKGITGGRVEFDRPIRISNIAIYNRKTNKRDKVCFKIQDNKKFRCYKSNNEKIEITA